MHGKKTFGIKDIIALLIALFLGTFGLALSWHMLSIAQGWIHTILWVLIVLYAIVLVLCVLALLAVKIEIDKQKVKIPVR